MALSAERLLSGYPHPGDQDIATWMARYSPALRRFFGRRVGGSDVDDLVQEVFLNMQTAKISSPIENAERYLFRVARNVLISRYRHDKARGNGANDGYSDTLEIADNLSPERIAIGREEYARARRAIVNLPPRARAAFQFHRFDNMTYCEIAQKMGITKEAVKDLMHRAIRKISDELAEVDIEP